MASDGCRGRGINDSDAETPQDVIVELAKELEKARDKRLNVAEPDTREESRLSGYESGLRDALLAFESMDEIEKLTHLPEWTVALENEDGDWAWYHPHALTRQRALEKARHEARDDLGTGPLNAYEVGGPIAR
jgi:hypothetical protein